MHCSILFALLASVSTHAAPSSTFDSSTPKDTINPRSFIIPRVRKPESVPDGPAAIAKVFRKYGIYASELDVNSNFHVTRPNPHRSQAGEVVAVPADPRKSEYLSPVTIGGQTMNVDFDTGSSDFWVFSTLLPRTSIGQHAAFCPKASATWKWPEPKWTWRVQYGDGSAASGLAGTDDVETGGIMVRGQALQLAKVVSENFIEDGANDGLLGLGFMNNNGILPKKQPTFLDNLGPLLKNDVFTVDLQEDGSGTYEFGRVDPAKYRGPITKIDIDGSRGYWQFESSSFAINGNKTRRSHASPGIVDTGTSLVLVDDSVASAYYKRIPSAGIRNDIGGWVFNCNETIPSFGVSIGGYMVNIPAKMIKYAPVGDVLCYGGIQPNNGFSLQVYGDILFRNAFVAFYRGNQGDGSVGAKLGIAAKS